MRYYKMTDAEGNLTAIGTGSGGVEISAEEYTVLAEEIAEKAALVAALAAGEITETDLREDWRDEIVRRAGEISAGADLYTEDELSAMTNAELEIILAGYGVSASMNKANMIRLILSLQGGDDNELV